MRRHRVTVSVKRKERMKGQRTKKQACVKRKKRVLVCVKRDLVCVKSDLVCVKRDLVCVKRDLVCVKRDLMTYICSENFYTVHFYIVYTFI
jgi:hypothetical protein